jgi:V/A-type H+-transporting ATPase subunit I
MVERMRYVNIMGPMDALNHAVDNYISRYEIQLEHTIKELANEKGLSPLPMENPYTGIVKTAERLVRMTGIDKRQLDGKRVVMGSNQAISVIKYAEAHFDKIFAHSKAMEAKRAECLDALKLLEPFKDINVMAEELRRFEYIGYQFGKMPISGFRQFETFLYNDAELILLEGKTDESSVWCVYFALEQSRDKVDSMFSSLHFEKTDLPDSVGGEALTGTIGDVCRRLSEEADAIAGMIEEDGRLLMNQADLDETVDVTKAELIAAYKVARDIEFYYDIRRFAAKTANDFYIFVGWMTERDAARLAEDAAEDESVVVIVEEGHAGLNSKPPTKLRNILPFRPFEMFVGMYGLPTYGEVDPTAFLAFTYTLLFGVMFADVGQGAVLSGLGFYLWRFKGAGLGKVMMVIGCSSALFGALFGSFFGFEFRPLLFHPAENSSAVLAGAVFLGGALITAPMILNIANAVKRGRAYKALFDPNGFAGLYFYVVVAGCAALIITGALNVSVGVIVTLVIVPFFMIMFRDFIIKKAARAKPGAGPAGPGEAERAEKPAMRLLETVIEMFEVLLTYFTNTVSFVRVGAFALSHAGMMSVVMMLASNEGGGLNPFVLVLGNLFVIGLEGLIVGIQVLRLEFYEMFSRFYEGAGRRFEPYKISYK